MITRRSFPLISLIFIFAISPLYSQSFGIIYEASPINYDTKDLYDEPDRTQIKNLFFNFNGLISETFLYTFRAGIGWNNYEINYKSNSMSSRDNHNVKTLGFPIEVEIRYQRFIGADSIFEPLLGFGLGYYSYKTEFENDGVVSSYTNDTKGFGQYITFGFNLHISNKVYSNIQFKKFMANNISTKRSTNNESYEWDYVQQRGLSDLSISLGLFFSLRYVGSF